MENAIITKKVTIAITQDQREASLKIKNPAIIEKTAFRFAYGKIFESFSVL